MSKTTVRQKEKLIAYHTFYGTQLPLAIKVGDYGYTKSSFGDTTTMALGDITLVIKTQSTQLGLEGINHIKLFKNRELMHEFKDYNYGNTLIRKIGAITVIMKHDKVILNKVYPKH